jgi:predicted metalloprotease with PDZ domain
MSHLALPDVGDNQTWLSEGLAVYVEGVARVQAGNRSQQDVFAEQMRQMPKGLPRAGEQGLDNTHTWARTYWGGAMFCFLADVEIHRRTGNRLGLQDAMRAVARESGGLSADWPITRVFATADAATGTKVLEEMYAQMKDKPVAPDLSGLWAKLGVVSEDGSITLHDDAPLADIRRAIMQPRDLRPANKT